MRWFKCVSPNSTLVLSTIKEVGKHGVFECFCVVAEALNQDVTVLDVEAVKNWAAVKRDRADKLLRFAQDILTETLKINGKSIENPPKIDQKTYGNPKEISQKTDQNVLEISEKSDKNLVDFDPSNPRGRNNNIITIDNNIDRNREREKENSHALDSEFKFFIEKGYRYLANSNDPNLANLNWVFGYLTIQFESIMANRDDLKPEQVLDCWYATCDKALHLGIYGPGWFRTTFEGKVKALDPSKTQVRPEASKPMHQKVMEATSVIYQLTRQTYAGSQLEYHASEGVGQDPYYTVKETGEKLEYRMVHIQKERAG